ncbi:glycosyltransferase family 2 protein [Patescibacteria group bacterium]|nr:MAG: glycosyltransferase family 2 protein [Patescibacteria group bacterium]
MKIRIFSPVFNAAKSVARLVNELDDVELLLKTRGHQLEVLIIDDKSGDGTAQLLDEASAKFAWLRVRHNEQNLGNAGNIIAGYHWGSDDPSDVDVVGCMDADGEHSPYALVRHLKMIESGECDGLAGSIIFPDHDASYHDRNMMRFWGGMQAAMSGIDGMFYIQSPGYNLHQRHRVAKALELFEKYKQFFAQNTTEQFPRWGMHGIMIHLVAVGTGAHIKAVYLECFGKSPNRTPDKLLAQANAANIHGVMLNKFLPKTP